MKYTATLIVVIMLFASGTQGQLSEPVQFSGIVLTEDSLKPVPFTHILIQGTSKGTISDFFGFFTFVARPGDVVVFSSVGFKTGYYKIPDTLSTDHYTMFQVMHTDTVYLPEAVIYPWPSPSQFKNAFLTLRVPDDDYDRARKNIALIASKEYALSTPMDGSMNFKNFVQNQTSNYYTMGQMPVNNLLNPFAWASFFKAWQNGDFKKPDINYLNSFPPD
jgi:hypothetical protein